ncbi:MAG: methylmalonyl-CoA mutase family protein [Xanthobacteraceae bacterium]
MTDALDELPLAAEFPPATQEQWRKLVDGVLKGAPFEKRLVSRTYDGLAISPLYARAADAEPVLGRSPGLPWAIIQRVDHPDPAAANTQALHDLENGATGLALVFGGSVGAYGYGLDASDATIERVLADVYLDAGIALDLDLSPQTKDAGMHVAALVKRRGIDPAETRIRFGFDPIGAATMRGGSPLSWDALTPIFNAVISDLAEQGFRGPFAPADGRVIHNAGGSEAQELGYALAVAVTYLRALEAGGSALDAARGMIYFRLAADADEFLTIAKFRAMRKLWARVEAVCGLAPKPVLVVAETAWRMMTQRDPYVNMLRETIATVAAGLGGADAVTVLPFTQASGLADRFARRVARNTQLLLIEESNLAKVADPTAGSGAIEAMTSDLCHKAWSLFQEIEQAGGAWTALEAGLIQQKVAAARTEREAAVARRKDAITGTSDYPDLAEEKVAVLDVQPVALSPYPDSIAFSPLPPLRLAQPYEALRDASDRVLAATGARPKIFLANLGRIADFNTRATFAKNFFEAGGIEAVANVGFAGRDEMVVAFKASGAILACLCSSDDVYAQEAVAAASDIKAAGGRHIYLAGRPGERKAELEAAGVSSFIYAGCDVLATLKAAHDILGTGNSASSRR